MQTRYSLADLFQLVTLLCVALGVTAAMGTNGTLIAGGLVYVAAPVYAFVTTRFRDAFRIYVQWNLLCALVVAISAIASLCGQWSQAFQLETGFREGFLLWTVFASGPCGLVMASLIHFEFPAINRVNEVVELCFCFAVMTMWIGIWRYFVKYHQLATPKGATAVATNYLLFILLVIPIFAAFSSITWILLLFAIAPHM